jgi:hypothetical protein
VRIVVTFDEELRSYGFSRERFPGSPIGGGSGGSVVATPRERGRSMPVYYSKTEEEQPVFHVFLGCSEGSKIGMENRVEKLKKRAICKECLVLMKQATWVEPHDHHDHETLHRHTGS